MRKARNRQKAQRRTEKERRHFGPRGGGEGSRAGKWKGPAKRRGNFTFSSLLGRCALHADARLPSVASPPLRCTVSALSFSTRRAKMSATSATRCDPMRPCQAKHRVSQSSFPLHLVCFDRWRSSEGSPTSSLVTRLSSFVGAAVALRPAAAGRIFPRYLRAASSGPVFPMRDDGPFPRRRLGGAPQCRARARSRNAAPITTRPVHFLRRRIGKCARRRGSFYSARARLQSYFPRIEPTTAALRCAKNVRSSLGSLSVR